MPPPRTGSVEPLKRADGTIYYRARIRLGDGSRERVDVPEQYTRPSGGATGEERAELYALAVQEREDETGELLKKKKARAAAGKEESADRWHARYLERCTERGLSTVGDKGYRWRKWISPKIGHKPIAKITREDVEDVRNALDDAIRDGRLAWKTAANVWGELSVSLGEACNSKRRELRALLSDPTIGVQPPETGGDKSKVYPYPSEFLAVASATDDKIPREWRELHAVAVYTYARPGELWVLEWSDVDLDDQKIRITKAWDFKSKKIKSTKTQETRSIPIEANLLPLLQAMHTRARGKGLVVPILSASNPDEIAEITRSHFEAAGCVRPRLYSRGDSERRVQFRSWRDAGITWSIVRGDDVVKVQRRAGHKLIGTTMRYIVEAENRGATFGEPFPVLPQSLTGEPKSANGSGQGSGQVTRRIRKQSISRVNSVRTEGLEPSRQLRRQNLNLVRLPIPPRSRRAARG
jgi:integrase